MITRIWNRLRRSAFPEYEKVSYAQSGEDLIANQIFEGLGIAKPSYLDIGAYHPYHFSNTFFFYKKGASGICVEPDPGRCALLKKARPRDLCLPVGVAAQAQADAKFFVMSSQTLSTFSRAEAEAIAAQGKTRIEKVLRIPTLTLPDLWRRHIPKTPDFLSMDVEGNELSLLKTLDWRAQRPAVLCVETLTFTENKTERKQIETIQFLQNQGYFVYGETYINTLFVDQARWRDR